MQVHASHPKEKPEVMIILWTCCDCKMAMAIPWRVRDKLRFVGRIRCSKDEQIWRRATFRGQADLSSIEYHLDLFITLEVH
jgi:hypothetical protein